MIIIQIEHLKRGENSLNVEIISISDMLISERTVEGFFRWKSGFIKFLHTIHVVVRVDTFLKKKWDFSIIRSVFLWDINLASVARLDSGFSSEKFMKCKESRKCRFPIEVIFFSILLAINWFIVNFTQALHDQIRIKAFQVIENNRNTSR